LNLEKNLSPDKTNAKQCSKSDADSLKGQLQRDSFMRRWGCAI